MFKRRSTSIYTGIAAAFILGVFGIVFASFNEQINYQGKLTDGDNVAVPDGDYCMKFLIHTAATGDASIWSEEWKEATSKITTVSGLFSTLLGTHSSLSAVDFNQDPLYLEVQFDPGCDATYEEIFSPRKRLGTVPAAIEAKQLGGKTWAAPGSIGSTTPAAGAFAALSASSTFTTSNGSILSSATGELTFGGTGGSYDENLTIDFESTENTVAFGTTTDVTNLSFGSFNLTTSGNISLNADNAKLLLGGAATGDSSIYYDNANLIINTALQGSGGLNLLTSSDTDDYITFTTSSNVPIIGTVGTADLKITASSGVIDFDDDNLTTTGTGTVSKLITTSGTDAITINTTNNAYRDIEWDDAGTLKGRIRYFDSNAGDASDRMRFTVGASTDVMELGSSVFSLTFGGDPVISATTSAINFGLGDGGDVDFSFNGIWTIDGGTGALTFSGSNGEGDFTTNGKGVFDNGGGYETTIGDNGTAGLNTTDGVNNVILANSSYAGFFEETTSNDEVKICDGTYAL